MKIPLVATSLIFLLLSCSQDSIENSGDDSTFSGVNCEMVGEERVQATGLLTWSRGGHHGVSKWLYLVEDETQQVSDISIGGNDEVYAVKFSDGFDPVNLLEDITIDDITDGLRLFGRWSGRLGDVPQECKLRSSYSYEGNLIFEVDGVEEVRVIR